MEFFGDLLDFAEDAEKIAAEDFAAVFGGVTTGHESRGDFGKVGGGIEPLRQLTAYAVEVRAQAYVVNAGYLGDVVDVVDEDRERWAGDAVEELALHLIDIQVGDLFALGFCFVFQLLYSFLHLRLLCLLRVAIGLGEEARVEVDLYHAALGVGTAGASYGAEHIVGHVAGRVAEGAGGGVRGDDRGAGDDQGAVEGAVGDVGDIDHHAQAVHFINYVFAELGQAFLGVGDGGVSDVAGAVGPVVGVGPGEGHVADAERVILAQEGERIFDGVATFDPHECCKFVISMGLLDAFGRGDKLDLVVVFGGLLFDGVNKFQSAMCVLAFVESGLNPDGEEFGAQVSLLDGSEVEIARTERVGQIEVLVEKTLRGIGVCVDDDGGLMDPFGVLLFG